MNEIVEISIVFLLIIDNHHLQRSLHRRRQTRHHLRSIDHQSNPLTLRFHILLKRHLKNLEIVKIVSLELLQHPHQLLPLYLIILIDFLFQKYPVVFDCFGAGGGGGVEEEGAVVEDGLEEDCSIDGELGSVELLGLGDF